MSIGNLRKSIGNLTRKIDEWEGNHEARWYPAVTAFTEEVVV